MNVRRSAWAIWLSCLAVTTLVSAGCGGGGGGDATGGSAVGGAVDASASGGTPDASGAGGSGGGNGGGGGAPGGSGGGGAISDAGTPDAASVPEICEVAEGAPDPEFLLRVGCRADFDRLASAPITSTLPGARSGKVVFDRQDPDNASPVYFQNSHQYPLHYDFASSHLSGNGLPIVPPLSNFNETEYFSPDRRFILGAVTYYDGPQRWVLEFSPYDTASAQMMETLFRAVAAHSYFGRQLAFHPTSEAVAAEAALLPADIPILTTDELYAGIEYQPLSLETGVGRLRFLQAADLETTYLSYQDLLVIDQVPNDITLVRGLISATFQTPLSHVNVLSQNRGTPNMGLRGAMENQELRALEGKLVELTVGAEAWSIREVDEATAQAFWDDHAPPEVTLPPLDLATTELRDLDAVTPEPGPGESLRDVIRESVRAYGGKAAHYSVLRRTDGVPIRGGFGVPVFYYDQFMVQNGFYDRLDAFLADPEFMASVEVRDQALQILRDDMMVAPVDQAFQDQLRAKLEATFPVGKKVRFRTSTNSEDLDGFPCAGCYESHTGDPADWADVLDAIRETYASAWLLRTFEERNFYRVAHRSVGMALLVHTNFPDEEANGVAVTNNPFAPSGQDPAFFVNVQLGGDVEVVAPTPGISSDQLLYYFSQPNQPVLYLAHSSLVEPGATVLTGRQIHTLGVALDAIQRRFAAAYGPASGNNGWYGLEVDFKFDDEDTADGMPALWIKQARPYPKPE